MDMKLWLTFVLHVLVLNLNMGLSIIDEELSSTFKFSKHIRTKPKIYRHEITRHTLEQIKNSHMIDLQLSQDEDQRYASTITVEYDFDAERKLVIDLQSNRYLIPKDYFMIYQRNGHHVVDNAADNIKRCYYKGTLRGYRNSWAAISICDDNVRGMVFDGLDMHYIEIDDGSEEHLLYKQSDFVSVQNQIWSNHSLDKNHKYRSVRQKRSNDKRSSEPYKVSKKSRFLELVFVVDNRKFKDLDRNISKVQEHCKDIAYILNGLYSALNIHISLVGIVTWSEYDEIVISPTAKITLKNFLEYRQKKLNKLHPNDNAYLITNYTFTDGVIGATPKSSMCNYKYSGGIYSDTLYKLPLAAKAIAHGIGHNLGMEHDTNACTCPDEHCIMAKRKATYPAVHWSACSINQLAFAFKQGLDYCLMNKPISLLNDPVCGNGIVEAGEQCDSGFTTDKYQNKCCNATTCMLHEHAMCDTGECCNLETCKLQNNDILCRSTDDECDLPEYCSGQSEYCPDNVHKMDTELCENGKAYCLNGVCGSQSNQCKILWGSTSESSSYECYKLNTHGERYGHCGYNSINQSFIKCQESNVLCGTLQCNHRSNITKRGISSLTFRTQNYINIGSHQFSCLAAIDDFGLNKADPGLTPNGASCGVGKMCINQMCLPVDSLRKEITNCPQNCKGNGVCNNLGYCHYNLGSSQNSNTIEHLALNDIDSPDNETGQ